MNPKEIIEYIDSKLKGNVVPLDTERDAIQLIEEYAQSYHESKVKNLSSNTVLSVSVCPDWSHNERVKMNDDKYCPICGKKLQGN